MFSFFLPNSLLKRQQADYDEIQTMITEASSCVQRQDKFVARKSPRVNPCRRAPADGDTWVEIVVTNSTKGENNCRSLFYSLKSRHAAWDEPPSGASKIIYKKDVDALARQSRKKKFGSKNLEFLSTGDRMKADRKLVKLSCTEANDDFPVRKHTNEEKSSNRTEDQVLIKTNRSDVKNVAGIKSRRIGNLNTKPDVQGREHGIRQSSAKPSKQEEFMNVDGVWKEKQKKTDDVVTLKCIEDEVELQLASLENQIFQTCRRLERPRENYINSPAIKSAREQETRRSLKSETLRTHSTRLQAHESLVREVNRPYQDSAINRAAQQAPVKKPRDINEVPKKRNPSQTVVLHKGPDKEMHKRLQMLEENRERRLRRARLDVS